MAGIVLAAGAGTRMGRPKALVAGADGVPWVARAAGLLADAGCSPVLVVLGAGAGRAAQLVPDDPRIRIVIAADWAGGMSHSLAAGFDALDPEDGDAVIDAVAITLVDLPRLPRAAVDRVLAITGRGVLARATWNGAPGHPVLVGREHWTALRDALAGDRGAGPYLRRHGAVEVDCSDLGDGRDQDVAIGESAAEPDGDPQAPGLCASG